MAVDMFLKIDGIDGESVRQQVRRMRSDILSFSWGSRTQQDHRIRPASSETKVQVVGLLHRENAGQGDAETVAACCEGEHMGDVNVWVVGPAKSRWNI